MAPRSIFYSWQTDSSHRFNRYFIEDCLKRAIKQVNREDLSDLVIDRDTKNVPGMPDIGHTILEKITKSAVVVADLTIINPAPIRRDDERPVSNPNVLFELGYAFGRLGPKAIIGVFNTAVGEIEDLPFDLRPKRLMTYRVGADDEKAIARTDLVDALAVAIRQCLGDTEEEQVLLNTRINDILLIIRLFGTEIEEWYGIEGLPKAMSDVLTAAQELPTLMDQRGYTGGLPSLAQDLIRRLGIAVRLAFNEENWPTIKEHIKDAGFRAGVIQSRLAYTLDQGSHGESVRRVATIPAELDAHLESLSNSQPRKSDLEVLSHDLRILALQTLIPEHPQFSSGLAAISLDLRRHVLRWAKNDPAADERSTAVKDVRDQLSRLIAKYDPVYISRSQELTQ
jgi:hypothetical protein